LYPSLFACTPVREEINMDAIATFKEQQKKTWSTFAPSEIFTCACAGRLVTFAGVRAGQTVLDVGCGTGVVALAAARTGARVTGSDLTPELLVRARENAAIAGVEISWQEADVEALPFPDGSFDAVVSQFGHMFAPRPLVAAREMLRVLKPGGTIAFSTWPPEMFTGRMFALIGRHLPPPPEGVSPPPAWGHVDTIKERLGDAVTDLYFERDMLLVANLSPRHARLFFEGNVGPLTRIVQALADDPPKLAKLRVELEALIVAYWDSAANALRQHFLMTRAKKAS
jgi:SAM-dependent methyltransferase